MPASVKSWCTRRISAKCFRKLPWITHRIGFNDVIGSFEGLMKPEAGVIKAIVELP